MMIRFRIDNERYMLRDGAEHVETVVYAEGEVEVASEFESFDHAFGTRVEEVVSYERSTLHLEHLSVSIPSGPDLFCIQPKDYDGYDELLEWVKIRAIDKKLKSNGGAL